MVKKSLLVTAMAGVLMLPQASIASAVASGAMKDTWYSIKASATGTAEILIYDEIGRWGVSAKLFAEQLMALGDIRHINLRIHSEGGDVFEGVAIYNALANHPATITVYIDGLAASMASVIAMVGDTIIMPENAMMMIHKPWGISGGDADDMRQYAELLDKVESALISSYTKKTGKTPEEIAALLSATTWLTAEEAVAGGFADQIAAPLKMAAALNSKRIQDHDMPNSMKALLRPRAQAPATPQAPAASPDAETIRAQVVAENKARVDAITSAFAMAGGRHDDIRNECIADMNCSVETAKDKLLAALGKNITPSTPQDNSHIHAGNGNLVGDSVRNCVMARAGHETVQPDNNYAGFTLRELARASLADRGLSVVMANPMDMVARAFTHSSSDFGFILLDVANKSVLQGWELAEETFELWTKKGQLSDFKPAQRVGMGVFPSLRQVREGAEFKYVTIGDHGTQISLATYGELFSITRQTIINDDMNMLTDIPMKMGMAAKATIADLVYHELTSNPKMADGTALFHANHGNLGTGGISVEALDANRQLMRMQKEGTRHLNIRPAFVLTPTCLESRANQVIKSSSVAGADANSGIVNPIQGFATVIAEPRLDDNDASAWYLAAPQGRDTIEVAYLNGVDTPYIEQQQGFSIDGVATKVRIDAGVKVLDHRGLVKSSGK